MKYLLVVFMAINLCFSQGWEKKQLLDEFGDKLNIYEHQLRVVGTFDNSAQSGAKAILIGKRMNF